MGNHSIGIALAEVVAATGGVITDPGVAMFTSFHTDSREVKAGGLFFALRGAEMDGHRFVPDAVARGAGGVVVSGPVDAGAAVAIRVEDTWAALYSLARLRLQAAAPLVVGVTGSNGKTSTKEMAAAVLGVRYQVLKTEGNLNTETGVPLTLLRLEPGLHTAAVIEMGMQGPGEIARLADLARPQIGVVTMIGQVHLEHFPDQNSLAAAKGELIEALPPDGLAVLPADDPYRGFLAALSRARSISVGLGTGDLRGEGYRAIADGCEFQVGRQIVTLPLAGRHQARNALAALAVGQFADVSLAAGAAALRTVEVPGRFAIRTTREGWRIVDDTYNASPESMLAAFETVAEMTRTGQLLAVLGEMRELGPRGPAEHQRVGVAAAASFAKICVIDVGLGSSLAEAAGADLVPDLAAASHWVRTNARSGDVVLIKGSHGLALEQLVARVTGS
ncbi:MAG TPA: UDP-N-acetylmuramoyl-tripeptide--D-alanyl-D-alanine ligase [Candidatus Dormibacteraeota bacterium]|nr:UDP-N-acetylmuramoyl-tripeptide--D-alanyl-D-alanine ligase [Candidatus Dormibacteraeota bacterium]